MSASAALAEEAPAAGAAAAAPANEPANSGVSTDAAPQVSTPVAPAPQALTAQDSAPQAQSNEVAHSEVNAAPPVKLDFQDARPSEERKTREYLTLWRFSCDFGVQDIGDEFVDRVGQLRHELAGAHGDRLAGKPIIVDHYHLYLNQRAMQSQNSWGTAVFGVLAIGAGAGAKTKAHACSKEKTTAGWFDPSEITTPWSPFIVEMTVRVDGKEHRIHSVYSPPKNMPAPGILTKFDVEALSAGVHAAVDKANALLVAEVGAQLGPVSAAPAENAPVAIPVAAEPPSVEAPPPTAAPNGEAADAAKS